MSSVSGGEKDEIHRAICVRHPNCIELHFCLNCNQVFCSDCRTADMERVNHLNLLTKPLQEVLNQRTERLTAIRKLIKDYIVKHDTTMEAVQKMQTEQKDQLEVLNKSVDEFAAQIVAEVEEIKFEAKLTIAKRAAAIWSENPGVTRLKEIEAELSKMREVRAKIDHEVRLCDRDELYLAEKNEDIEKNASKLLKFKQETLQLPDKSCFQLFELQTELLAHMTQLKRELLSMKIKFLNELQELFAFRNMDQLTVEANPVATFPKEKLSNENDKYPLIIGVVSIGKNTDALYFVTRDNSKIKEFVLKTSLLTEVIDITMNIVFYISDITT